mgnify:FL=1
MSKEKEIKKTKDTNKKANKAKKTTSKKESIFNKISKYFKGVFKELKRIRWTSGKELLSSSVTSVIFIAFFALYFTGIELLVSLLRSIGK